MNRRPRASPGTVSAQRTRAGVHRQLRGRRLQILADLRPPLRRASLRVSLAAASTTLDSGAQASAALDEVLLLLGAERALLFTADGEGKLKLAGGRSSDKQDILEVTGFSASVVKRTALSREATVVTGLESTGDVSGLSISAHGLRSIVAVPLVIGDRLVGVAYADSHLARYLFTADDVQILQALANHIAVGLELADAGAAEIDRRLLEMDVMLAPRRPVALSSKVVGHLRGEGSSRWRAAHGGARIRTRAGTSGGTNACPAAGCAFCSVTSRVTGPDRPS